MKVGIMTVPFNNNYGGFLQAFALKRVLMNMGHEVVFVMRRRNYQRVYMNRWKNLFRYLAKKDYECQFLNDHKLKRLSKHTNKFVNKYLKPWTKECYRSEQLDQLRNLDVDVYIAGSDQCWRAKFAYDYIDDYFFRFLKGTKKKRIAYAASFGTEEFEYSLEMQKSVTELLKEFSAISVRESSGISLLENYFDVPKGMAVQVLDPTLLLPTETYRDIIKDFAVEDKKYVFTYILDGSEEKDSIVKSISDSLSLSVVSQEAQTASKKNEEPIEPVELWLSRIANASFVVTDSFHGTVFSILFNKPFLVYGNKERGAARFETLLSMFNLQDRYVECREDFNAIDYKKEINWDEVNRLLEEKRCFSLNYLINSIK